MRHIPRYEEWKAANTGGKIKIARDNIHDKAQIAAYHYITRFTALMENANMPKSRIAPPDEQPPMLLRHEQQGLDYSNLAQLHRRAQLQKCSNTYCLRENKRTGTLANTDITPRTALQALLNYLSEYCTKAGVKVPQYWDMLRATQGFELTPIPTFNREADEQAHR
ncbi:MAG: Coatomer subunit alpha [Aureobasidium pullulans]|nr:MAG: Coatomer subunit alpha [Aureobasidium pullulans]